MRSKNKEAVAFSSVLASLALTVLKLIVGIATGSIGILSEAAHSLLDLGAAVLTFFAVRVGDKPADDNHPYGHGKAESVSALVETGLLFLTSAWIIYEAVKRLLENTVEIEVAWYSFAVMGVSILIDFSRSRALQKVAQDTKSQALEADALHFSSDILSSLVVIVGLALSLFGVHKADAFAAIGVSFFVLHAGYSLGKRTLDVLLDAAPEGLTDKVVSITQKVEGVLQVKKTRVRVVGATAFVDICVAVARSLPLKQAQEIATTVEQEIHKELKEADITVKTEPLALTNETVIDKVQIIAKEHGLAVHDVVVHVQQDKRYVSFDLEVVASLSFKEAHHIASHLEQTLQKELGNDIEVTIHIEPIYTDSIKGKDVSKEHQTEIETYIGQVVKEVALIKEVHEIKIRQSGRKVFISLHCIFDDNESLEKVHEAASRFEELIKHKYHEVERVLVHPEPLTEKDK